MESIITWNVNGIRAISKKGFFEWFAAESPDILCLQETKAHPSQLDQQLLSPKDYHVHYVAAEKKGYSGLALFSKQKPQKITLMGEELFDNEGRVQVAYFDNYVVINAYFPNSGVENKRLPYKLAFCEKMLELCNRLTAEGYPIVLCGDYNIAHTPLDLARPKENENSAGYLPEERAWMSQFIAEGYIDILREFEKENGHYTWWSYRARGARSRNIGWRIDYHCCNQLLLSKVQGCKILKQILGSDHCPVKISLKSNIRS